VGFADGDEEEDHDHVHVFPRNLVSTHRELTVMEAKTNQCPNPNSVTVVSVVRLQSLILFANSANITCKFRASKNDEAEQTATNKTINLRGLCRRRLLEHIGNPCWHYLCLPAFLSTLAHLSWRNSAWIEEVDFKNVRLERLRRKIRGYTERKWCRVGWTGC
jgi:hypothetical protein